MAAIISTSRASLNSLRLRSQDCQDDSIKILSNFGQSERLPKHVIEDFSWNKDGLLVVKNTSEQHCTLYLEVIACAGNFIIMRSSHQSSRTFAPSTSVTRLLKGGEALTFRSNHAQDVSRGEYTNL